MDKRLWIGRGVIVAACFVGRWAAPASAADVPTTQPAAANQLVPAGDEDDGPPPVPTVKGRLADAVRGGNRCPTDGSLWVKAIQPIEVGRTTSASPALVFYISKPTEHRVLVRINSPNDAGSGDLMEWSSDGRYAAGFHEIDLAALGVKVQPDVLYQWNVSIRTDEANPRQDAVDTGFLQYHPAKKKLAVRLAAADGLARADVYGTDYYYDAVGVAYDALHRDPKDAAAKAKLQGLVDAAKAPQAEGAKPPELDFGKINPPEKKADPESDKQ